MSAGDITERSLLGAVMLDSSVLDRIRLDPRDFHDPGHEALYSLVIAMRARGEAVDVVTVADALRRSQDPVVRRIAAADLHAMVQATPSAEAADLYADMVAHDAALRRFRAAGLEIVQGADSGIHPAILAERAADAIRDAAGPGRLGTRARYGDVAALLDGGLPAPPEPEVLTRTDGAAIFYTGKVNYLYGDPETGKTFVALAAAVDVLGRGGSAAFLDLDHNTMQAVVARLVHLGADPGALADPGRFRYAEPEDAEGLLLYVADLRAWRPGIVVLDSVGEMLPMLGLSSNSPDDFTRGCADVLGPLAKAGACVVGIDHLAQSAESRAMGPTGTKAKKRALDGSMLRVTQKRQFVPGSGGSCSLALTKDRHGGLREQCPPASRGREQFVGTFEMGAEQGFSVHAPEPAGAGTDASAAPFRPTWYMERVSLVLEGGTTSKRGIRDGVSGNHGRTDDALRALLSEGYARSDGAGYASTKPYRQSEDPLSDKYEGPGTR
ncbi:DnaB-like helicase N-terminal domain-containing protein [Sinomonas sp. ASV486]|uniref:DnaB-like helicase N-terminal domain-containing protein n=1 Tax=Sinomonas sp. ASV486 TaxID=3051170 RepID=UPI0027DCA8B6|nr:DnaB-like helicase N-terminal domain-containing protein [Sinomonas sp. ASV486]MDQ4491124.1 DnaB-like helicase N-terminal domain-containing protein [Sinomonas sp. ASV486]